MNPEDGIKDLFDSLRDLRSSLLYLEQAEEYVKALFDRALFKVGDRVRLKETPVITENELRGWLPAKHFLIKGALATARKVNYREGQFVYLLEFDNESYLGSNGVYRSPSIPSLYLLAEDKIEHAECVEITLAEATKARHQRTPRQDEKDRWMNMDTSGARVDLLDYGYVTLIETWGSDERIIEAARMSTQKGFEGWGPYLDGTPGDERLLAYLWRNNHLTPFEMAGAVFEVQAPIFVIREWVRHRTQGFNEASARYAPLPELFYVPTVERLMLNADGKHNKQAGTVPGADALTAEAADDFRVALMQQYDNFADEYRNALQAGVPKELARCAMPVGQYSRMRVTANLRNWLAFLKLRTDTSAQWEIQQYALAVQALLAETFPRTLTLYTEQPCTL